MIVMGAHDRVRAARLLAGLTLDELAAKLGVQRVNLVRWEQKQALPYRQTAHFAAATGLPESWLICKRDELEGLIVSRPIRPGAKVAKNVFARITAHLLEALPQMCPGAKCITVSSSVGGAYIFITEGAKRYCLVVFACAPLAEKLEELSGTERFEVDASAWWDAYLQPDYEYLRRILEVAGCDEWAKEVPCGEPDDQPATITAKIEITVPEAEIATVAINEIKRVVKSLRESGCTVAMTIEESSGHLAIAEGAPVGHTHRPLKNRQKSGKGSSLP